MIMAASFLISKNWIQPKWPSTREWMNTPQYGAVMEYNSTIKINATNMDGSLNNDTEQKKLEMYCSIPFT